MPIIWWASLFFLWGHCLWITDGLNKHSRNIKYYKQIDITPGCLFGPIFIDRPASRLCSWIRRAIKKDILFISLCSGHLLFYLQRKMQISLSFFWLFHLATGSRFWKTLPIPISLCLVQTSRTSPLNPSQVSMVLDFYRSYHWWVYFLANKTADPINRSLLSEIVYIAIAACDSSFHFYLSAHPCLRLKEEELVSTGNTFRKTFFSTVILMGCCCTVFYVAAQWA